MYYASFLGQKVKRQIALVIRVEILACGGNGVPQVFHS